MSNDKSSSPKDLAARVSTEDAKQKRLEQRMELIRREGVAEGIRRGHSDLLDFLQTAYTGPTAPDRGTPEAAAILTLAHDAAAHFRQIELRAKKSIR